jgi:hypothetical protein
VDRETIWTRFSGGKTATVAWYRQVYERLRQVGFEGAIMAELDRVTSELEGLAG